MGSIPSQGMKIPHLMQCDKINKLILKKEELPEEVSPGGQGEGGLRGGEPRGANAGAETEVLAATNPVSLQP